MSVKNDAGLVREVCDRHLAGLNFAALERAAKKQEDAGLPIRAAIYWHYAAAAAYRRFPYLDPAGELCARQLEQAEALLVTLDETENLNPNG